MEPRGCNRVAIAGKSIDPRNRENKRNPLPLAAAGTFTEVFWSALHGLATLSRAGRLRPEFYDQRMSMLVDQFSTAP